MFTVYSKSQCTYCTAAKALLEKHQLSYEEKSVEQPDIMAELRKRAPSARTLPQIFKDDVCIGGFHELKIYFQENGDSL